MENNIRAIFDNGKQVVEVMINELDKKYLMKMIRQLNNTVECREVDSCFDQEAILVRIIDSSDIPFIEIACRIELAGKMAVKEEFLGNDKTYIKDFK